MYAPNVLDKAFMFEVTLVRILFPSTWGGVGLQVNRDGAIDTRDDERLDERHTLYLFVRKQNRLRDFVSLYAISYHRNRLQRPAPRGPCALSP